MTHLLSLVAATFAVAPVAVAAQPAYVEARLDSDGVFHSSADNGGRSGARYQAGSTSKFAVLCSRSIWNATAS